jgi:hypothetical protein
VTWVDPDFDQVEAIAWWDPTQLAGNPAVRPELLDSIDVVLPALCCEAVAKASGDPKGQAPDGGVSPTRAAAIAPAQRRIVDGLDRLAGRLGSGDVATGGFVAAAVRVLRDGIREGLTLGTRQADRGVVAKLSDEFEAWRAAFDARFDQYATVAQTAYEEGQALATLSSGDDWLIRWDAKPDACDLCAERNGNVYEPGDLPGLPGMGGFGKLATVCRGGPHCFPAAVLVQSVDVELGYKRWYVGELVEIMTAGGRQLTGTPNHPVLTDAGWVPLGELNEGSHLVCGALGKSSTVDPHVQAVPTSIKEVVDAAANVGAPVRTSVLPVDFHGDGAGSSEVEIVGAYRELRNRGDATFAKPVRKFDLTGTDMGPEALAGLSYVNPFLIASTTTPGSRVGGSSDGAPLLGTQAAHALPHALGSDLAPAHVGAGRDGAPLIEGGTAVAPEKFVVAPANGSALFGDDSLNERGGTANLAGETGSGLPLDVTLDDVVNVHRRTWSGHVFNLQTGLGWYIAEGIIVSNCRCGITYLQPGTPGQETPSTSTPPTTGRHRAVPGTVADFRQQMRANVSAAREARQAGHTDPTGGPYAELLGRIADQRAEQQRPYLQGLAQDLQVAASRARNSEGRGHAGLLASGTLAATGAGTVLAGQHPPGSGEAPEDEAAGPVVRKDFDPAEVRDGHGRWSHLGAAENVVQDALGGNRRDSSAWDDGPGHTWDAVEHDYGAALDGREISSDGAAVTAHESGVLTLAFPGQQQDHWSVLTALDPDEARELADNVERALDINPDDPAYEDAHEADTGLIDWVKGRDGSVVGVYPTGEIRVATPGRSPDHLDEVDLSHDDGWRLVDGLRDMAALVDETVDGD